MTTSKKFHMEAHAGVGTPVATLTAWGFDNAEGIKNAKEISKALVGTYYNFFLWESGGALVARWAVKMVPTIEDLGG